ncbi:MAG: hypothetical protein OEQ53_12215 [Saprospiraceae bacterium]|nr:hypothetical protein [Saprospiraceae bacterium]
MKHFTFLSLILLFCISMTTSAVQAQAKNAFYVELLGNGLLFSANYDLRISQDRKWGARAGIGYIGSIDDGGVVTIPLMANHLLGKDGKYFEVGAGITYLSATADFFDDNVSDIVGTLSFMYRSQPIDSGFMWKIGLTPVLASGVFVPWWPGIAIGYTW